MGGEPLHVRAVGPDIYPIGLALGEDVKSFPETLFCNIYVLPEKFS
jgi:hypothetical protein